MSNHSPFIGFPFSSYRRPNMPFVPFELQHEINNNAMESDTYKRPFSSQLSPHPAMRAPASGSSPLMKLPTELRRAIFAASLPDQSTVYNPTCKDDNETATAKPASCKKKTNDEGPAHGVLDLMLLNKRISAEITEILYEERFFVIHVHEGLRDGGIEFQHVDRQPLQYKDSAEDDRFHKFGKNDTFGFRRLKKIILEIHPTMEEHTRHISVNTYFMNLALCRLLDRYGEDKHNRITSLIIRFVDPKTNGSAPVGRMAIQRAEHYWWDPDQKKPRETSVHNLSNVELVLRPFAHLTGCHSVSVELPKGVRDHLPSIDFAEALVESMKSKDGGLLAEGDSEQKIESARSAMEEYVNYTLHGTEYQPIRKLSDTDMHEEDPGSDDLDSDNEQPKAEHRKESSQTIDCNDFVHEPQHFDTPAVVDSPAHQGTTGPSWTAGLPAQGSAIGRDDTDISDTSVLPRRRLRSDGHSSPTSPDNGPRSGHVERQTHLKALREAELERIEFLRNAQEGRIESSQHTGLSSPLRGSVAMNEADDDDSCDEEL